MTREEEIKQAAKTRADQYEHPVDWNNCYHHYIQGAEWADKHPKEGLWDAQKVTDWLRNNAGMYLEDNRKYGEGCEYDTQELIKDLRKAMED